MGKEGQKAAKKLIEQFNREDDGKEKSMAEMLIEQFNPEKDMKSGKKAKKENKDKAKDAAVQKKLMEKRGR